MSLLSTAKIANVVVVGGGLAGLYTALRLAPQPVTIIASAPLGEGASSAWAQGGIAAAVAHGDTADAHASDTIEAGAGLVDEQVAQMVAAAAPQHIRDLIDYGVPFDRDGQEKLICSREAAHSAHRVVRVKGDGTGRAIMQALIEKVRSTPSITLLEGYTAIDLIAAKRPVMGLRLERMDDPAAHYVVEGIEAVILASGGIGGLYGHSTNPISARGSALALAARAGASVADAEFVQFHPTAIDVEGDPTPLATEALRGEGSVLVNRAGHRFMQDHHPAGELGPRDIVARGVFQEIKAGRGAYLDCRTAIGHTFSERFPAVWAQCREHGIDPATELIPVTPAEHYHMGGVATDLDGRTIVQGLWAVGECASTGLHGANRLASNSLIETVVFAARAANGIRQNISPGDAQVTRVKATHLPDAGARGAAMAIVRATLSDHAGVIRNETGLRSAVDTLSQLEEAADGDLTIVNAALAARFIVEAALRRKESRGAHFREDFAQPDETQRQRRTITLQGLNMRFAPPLSDLAIHARQHS